MKDLPIEQLLIELRARDIYVLLEDGEKLRVNAPKGVLTEAEREQLSARKSELINYLQTADLDESQARESSIPTAPRNGDIPLSYDQARMWFLHQMEPEASVYNLQTRIIVKATPDQVEQAWNVLLNRHEILRTRYTMGKQNPVQHIDKPQPVKLEAIDLSGRDDAGMERELKSESARSRQIPFNLVQGPVWRCLLFKLRDGHAALVVTIHHIATDGWSLNRLGPELRELCNANRMSREPALPNLPVQYADFSAWQHEWFEGHRLDQELDYWRDQLKELPTLDLLTDYPRPPVQTHNGKALGIDLPQKLLADLRNLCREYHVTLFMALLTVFYMLLYRYTGQKDIVVGTPIAGRTRPELANVHGLFLNSLVLRSRIVGEQSFADLLPAVREVTLGAFAHQHVPFQMLVEEFHPQRDMSRNPLFQVLFNKVILPDPVPEDREFAMDKAMNAVSGQEGQTQFDLSLAVHESGERVGLLFHYNTDLFYTETIERMSEHFIALATAAARQPDCRLWQLQMLSETERGQLLEDWNRTDQLFSIQSLPALFEQQVKQNPDSTALVHGDSKLRYVELAEQVHRLAHYLQRLGVSPESRVGVCMERGIDMVVSLLAVLEAGGAYVPLDPDYPAERLEFMIEDSGAELLLTRDELLAFMPVDGLRVVSLVRDRSTIGEESADAFPQSPGAGQLAYIIYTSGSTGKPKGVMITHHALANFLQAMAVRPGMNENEVLLAVTTISFDIAALELFLPLSCGACSVIASREDTIDGTALESLLERHHVTTMQATPATWQLLLAVGWQGNGCLRALCGGEEMPRDLAKKLLATCRELWNLYGPTETTVWSTVEQVDSTVGIVSIGRPIANTRVYILDAYGQPAPVGVAGELCIGGNGVADGYWRRPELTADRFIDDPFASVEGCRMYRTGDLARYLPDSRIEYLGRIDHQFKLRGFRIEAGEIESVFERHPGVESAVAVIREDRPGDQCLVAYIVPVAGQKPDVDQLRQAAAKVLPDYMVPSTLLLIDVLPLTPSGKVNRKALPAPEGRILGKTFVPPQTETQQRIAEIWRDVLQLDRVGIDDNFFELGGHSLRLVQVQQQLQKILGDDAAIPVIELFGLPTVRALAERIGESSMRDKSIADAKQLAARQRKAAMLQKKQRRAKNG